MKKVPGFFFPVALLVALLVRAGLANAEENGLFPSGTVLCNPSGAFAAPVACKTMPPGMSHPGAIFTNTLTLNPLTNANLWSGTQTLNASAPTPYPNGIYVNDYAALPGTNTTNFTFGVRWGGAGGAFPNILQGARQAMVVQGSLLAPGDPADPATYRPFVVFAPTALASSGDNGTAASPQGYLFSINSIAFANPGATFLSQVTTEEADFGINPGASALRLYGKAIVNQGTQHAGGSGMSNSQEAYLIMYGNPLHNGLIFGRSNTGDYPVDATGTVINNWPGTVTNYLDMSSLTITGNTFTLPGGTYKWDGAGNITANGLTILAASTASLNMSSVTANVVQVMSKPTGANTASFRVQTAGVNRWIDYEFKWRRRDWRR